MFGLILAGGHSKRMGQDKALLSYAGRSQLARGFELLQPFCEQVLVSTRNGQSLSGEHARFAQLPDSESFQEIGPIGGILTALSSRPMDAWLILACDLPFVREETIRFLLEQRDRQKVATAFISSRDGLPEPLCAIWEPASRPVIESFLGQGIKCPRKVLIKAQAHLLPLPDPQWLDNVNTPQDYDQAIKKFDRV
jgi:molybdenum cofactor guanylyltransferase